MKKLMTIILAGVMVIGLVMLPLGNKGIFGDNVIRVSAAAFGDYKYEILNDGTIEITGYDGNGTDIKIPNKIGSKNVTSIGNDAFAKQTHITSIEIPETVAVIGERAFEECKNLKSVTIGNGVKNIGMYAFKKCTSITSIIIPDSVINIGCASFSDCTSLKSVIIGNNIKSIERNAFAGTPFLNNQSTDVKYVGNWAIGCSDVTSVSIRTGTVGIADFTCFNLENLKNITIPDSVKSIGYNAFLDCKNLIKIVIPDSVTSIGAWAFDGCTNLAKISMGNKVECIGREAFHDTAFLDNQSTDVKYVGNWAVDCDKNSKSVAIKSEVVGIADQTFRDCVELKNVSMGANVKSIGNYAFLSCSSLGTVIIPNSVTNIGDGAFYDCTKLKNITIGNSVKNIGEDTFLGCENIEILEIPNSVVNIGDGAFYDCIKLKSISIGKGLKNIGDGAFHNCKNLVNITVSLNNNSFLSQDGVLFNKNKTKLIQYPIGNTRTSYVIPNSVVTIKRYAFEFSSHLKYVTIPKSVKNIGGYAFSYIDNLVIKCYKNTIGYNYAVNNGFEYELLVSGVSLNKTSLSLIKGKSAVLKANISPKDATRKTIKWSSSNSKIATVGSDGIAKGINKGTATITAKSTNGKTASCKVIVKIPVSKMDISVMNMVYTGKQVKPSVIVKYGSSILKNGTDFTLKYGKNISAGTGTVNVIGKGYYTGTVAKTFIIKKKNQSISASSVVKNYGSKDFSLNASANGKGKLTYISSEKKVAVISKEGIVTIKGCGESEITITAAATANYKAASRKITVTVTPKKAVIKIISSPGKGKIKVQWTKDMAATGYQICLSENKNFSSNATKTFIYDDGSVKWNL